MIHTLKLTGGLFMILLFLYVLLLTYAKLMNKNKMKNFLLSIFGCGKGLSSRHLPKEGDVKTKKMGYINPIPRQPGKKPKPNQYSQGAWQFLFDKNEELIAKRYHDSERGITAFFDPYSKEKCYDTLREVEKLLLQKDWILIHASNQKIAWRKYYQFRAQNFEHRENKIENNDH